MHVSRDADVSDQADDAGTVEREALGMERPLAALENLGALLEHENRGATNVADVDRLVARVEDENPTTDGYVRAAAVEPVAVGRGTWPFAVGAGIPRR
jgi:hypothetical protein